MIPKPKHLGPDYAAQFKDSSVVAAYHCRPPYPPELFDILSGLVTVKPRIILDAGCGTGSITRPFADYVERVDAVDFSPAMIAAGKKLPGGDHPHINWIDGPIEEVQLAPSYALITAAQSLHWMAWDIVLPRFRQLLVPNGYLALLSLAIEPPPWNAPLRRLISVYSTNLDFQPYDLLDELQTRALFVKVDEARTRSVPFWQTIDAYVESLHSQNGLSRNRMEVQAAAAFDKEVRAMVSDFCADDRFELEIWGHVVWGKPQLLPTERGRYSSGREANG